jgi:PLAT/LH2 domain
MQSRNILENRESSTIVFFQIHTSVSFYSGFGAAWHLAHIEVEDITTGQKFMFPCNRWLSKSEEDKQICRELTCANLPSPKVKGKIGEYRSETELLDVHWQFSR